MKRTNLIGHLMAVFALLLLSTVVYAGKPVWAFTPLSATSITVPANGTATIQYQVRNQSPTNPHRLVMMPLSGVSQDAPCVVRPKGQSGDSCTLTLTVTGNKVPKGGISRGPKLCQANKDGTPNPNQCYQPSKTDGLHIAVGVEQFTVSASGDTQVTPSPTSQTVDYNQQGTVNLTVATGYTAAIASDTCGGSLSGTTYTTGAVTSNCSVSFSSTINSYTVSARGDTQVTPSPTSQTVDYNQQGTVNLTVATGYTAAIASDTCGGSLSGTTYTTGAVTSNCSVSFSSTINSYTVSARGDTQVTPSPTSQTVDYNQQGTVNLTVATGYTAAIASDTCGGSLSGTTYTTGAVTSNCSVSFSGVAVFPVAEGPSNVIAVPGNGQVAVSWTAPTNTGTGTISSYTVTYGQTSGTAFTTAGCTTSSTSTSCTLSGLKNGTAYTFAVTTTTTLSGANETGPATFSSSATPTAGLAVSPSTLALSSLASSHSARSITLTNNSNSPITLSAVPTTYSDFSPSLPSDVTISSTCSTSTPLAANGGSCTVTITPGTTASNNSLSQACTNGTAPETSVFNVTTSPAVAINAVVLGYGCQYQGGYLLSIDDTAPTTSSIGGTVVATADQSSNAQWSPSGAVDSIWGIDDTSTPTNPSPNASSSESATLKLGQLNCNAVNDGACATTNMFVYYGAGTNYAAGLCKQALNNSGTTCTGGSNCYTDWHLPSTCELGPFGSTGLNTGNYPSLSGSQSCSSGSTNIQNELVSTSIVSLSGIYWSATEYSDGPQYVAWYQLFASSGSVQYLDDKYNDIGVRCVRGLTH